MFDPMFQQNHHLQGVTTGAVALVAPRHHAVAPVEEGRRHDAPGPRRAVHREGVDGVVHLAAFLHLKKPRGLRW